MTTTNQNKRLTTGQVALLFGVDERTVRRWSDDGKLPHTRTLGGERRFNADDIERALRGDA